MKKLLLVLFLLVPSVASAQIGSVPYSFTPGTTILSAEINANFATAYTNALDRTNGVALGSITLRAILAASNNLYDIGASGTRFATIYGTTFNGTTATFTGGSFTTLTIGTLTLTTLTCTGCVGTTQAAALDAGDTTTGTFADARLSSNVPLKDAANTFTARNFIDGNLNGNNIMLVKNAHATGYGLGVQGGGASTYAFNVVSAAGTQLLELAGTGALSLVNTVSITKASGDLLTFTASTGTNGIWSTFNNTGGISYVGRENSTGGNIFTGSSAYATLLGTGSAHSVQFATNNTVRFGIDSNGNWLKGASIMDSTGTPTISGGFGTGVSIVGTDYAFVVTINNGTGGASTQGTVAFGRTFTTAPVCVATNNSSPSGRTVWINGTSTTAVTLDYTSTPAGLGTIYVLCRGY